jgi:hypothetical protein
MQNTKLFIAGGIAPGCWEPDPDFEAGAKVTLYEASMALGGMHPYAGWIAGLCCHTDDPKADDLKAKTLAGMATRERAVSTWPRPLAIYRALRAEVLAGRLSPLGRRARCIDRPDVKDHTRYVLALDNVLAWYASAFGADDGKEPRLKIEVFQAWFANKYPKGAPAGTTAKALAREFKPKMQISESTVRRALGKKK